MLKKQKKTQFFKNVENIYKGEYNNEKTTKKLEKLANDSAESAVRTRQLIQNALSEIESGNEITNRTQKALAQETSATSEELSAQAATLSDLTGQFRLR